MRPAWLARTALGLFAGPAAVLLALALAGELAAAPALLAAVALALVSACIAALWAHDMRVLLDRLRGGGGATRLAGTTTLALAIERAVRDYTSTAAEVHGALRAETAIVERLPDPLIVLGRDRAVLRANAAARTLFGTELGAVLRQPALRAAIDRALSQETQQEAELRLAVPMPRDVVATVIPLDPPLAGGGRIIAVLSDRTRDRAVERMRADFVANASHELRTPLASLIGFIDTLRGPAMDDPPAQVRFLGIMAEQAQRMNRLIDDLLSLSRIELTEHQPPAGMVDLAQLVARQAAAFEPRVAARRMRLDVQVTPGLPHVTGDSDQLSQVMQNLMDNAVKYGRDDGVVSIAAEPATGGRWPLRPGVVLAVADDGQGIARSHIPRLTERFYRVDKGRSRNVGGTGLGLAIVKHIVNRHRGQMLIESEEGAGSRITVWLPQASIPATIPAAASTPEVAAAG